MKNMTSYFHQMDNTNSALWEEGKSFFQTFQNLWSVSKSKYVYNEVIGWNFIYCSVVDFGNFFFQVHILQSNKSFQTGRRCS